MLRLISWGIWIYLLFINHRHCVEINLKSIVGPKSLTFLNTFENTSYDHSIFVLECSVNNIKNLSTDDYNYWYSYFDYEYNGSLTKFSTTSDIITPELIEIDNNENNKYIFTKIGGLDAGFQQSPSSCSSLTKSNIFTCYGSYNMETQTSSTECNIYDNENGKWLDQPIIINSQNNTNNTDGSQYTISCFGDIFIVIWHNLNCDAVCYATSQFFYTIIDANTFDIIRRNISIFTNLPINNWTPTISPYPPNPNILLFTFSIPFSGVNRDTFWIYSVHYDTAGKYLSVDYNTSIENATSAVSATGYQINGLVHWVLPVQYDGYYMIYVFNHIFSVFTTTKVIIPSGETDIIEIVRLDMLNEYGNYFGIINLDWNYQGISGGEIGINFTAFEIQGLYLEQISQQVLFYDAENVTDPSNNPVMCVETAPDGGNSVFMSFWPTASTAPSNADNSPQAQIWEVLYEN